MIVNYYKNYLYTHRYKLKKKKKKVLVHGFASETGSDSPIGSDRDRGRDNASLSAYKLYRKMFEKHTPDTL